MPPKRRRGITVDQLLAAQSGKLLTGAEEENQKALDGSKTGRKPRRTKAQREADEIREAESKAATAENAEANGEASSTTVSESLSKTTNKDSYIHQQDPNVASPSATTHSLIPEGFSPEEVLATIEHAAMGDDAELLPHNCPLSFSALPEEVSQDPVEVVGAHIIRNTMVGREVPNFLNRAFVMPTCYVPRGGDTIEAIQNRSRQQPLPPNNNVELSTKSTTDSAASASFSSGPDNNNTSTNSSTSTSEEERGRGEPSPDQQSGEAVSKSTASEGTPFADSEGISTKNISESTSSSTSSSSPFTAEEGVHFDALNAFMCPFMVHQRVGLEAFTLSSSSSLGSSSSKQEQHAATVQRSRGGEEAGTEEVEGAHSSTLPTHELTPAQVMEKVALRAMAIANEKSLPISSVHVGTTTYTVEQTLMRHRARPPLEVPSSASSDEFVLVDCDVRLGVVAVFPKAITQTDAESLSSTQRAYVSRFQLLQKSQKAKAPVPEVAAEEKAPTTTAVDEESDPVESLITRSPTGGDIHIASDIVVGAFDPYLNTNTFSSIQAALKKMSASKIDKAAEAVQLRSKIPIYQLAFQSREPGDESVLVLETHDNGNTWVEIISQEGLGSITSPLVNTKKVAVEAFFTAKHVRKCTAVESEWASYYLQHTFVEGGPSAGKAAAASAGSRQSKAGEDIANIGYVHPVVSLADSSSASGVPNTPTSLSASVNYARKLEALRTHWQLVSIERTSVQAAQCVESSRFMPNLAVTVEAEESAREWLTSSSSRGGGGGESLAPLPKAQTTESALILWMWQHTKTLFADDGVSFLRGATTFRRRVSVSNEHILRERNGLWVIGSRSAQPQIAALNRFAAALQTTFNEVSTVLTQRFADIVHTPDKGYRSLVGDLPLYVFAGGNARGISQLVVPPLPLLPRASSVELEADVKAELEAKAAEVVASAESLLEDKGLIEGSERQQATPEKVEGTITSDIAPFSSPSPITIQEANYLSAESSSTSPAAAAKLADAPQKPRLLSSTISLAEHGAFLQRLAKVPLPAADLAKSFAFHAYIPWNTVHYPLSLNTFTSAQLPLNLAPVASTTSSTKDAPISTTAPLISEKVADGIEHGGVSEALTAEESLATSSSTASLAVPSFLFAENPNVPTFVVRRQGKLGILKAAPSARGEGGREDVVLKATETMTFDKTKIVAEAEAAVSEGMRALFTSSFGSEGVAVEGFEGSQYSDTAPVFSVSFGHSEWASFDCQNILADVLVRMLGKSVKTTVSALCFSDHPSTAVRGLRPEAAAHVNSNYTPLGTRSVTSVFLDSKDASRSQVTNIGKLFKSPESQEHGVRTLLRRMLAPTSLQQARVLVQSIAAGEAATKSKEKNQPEGRELIPEGAPEPAVEHQPYVYKVAVLPEEALDIFRPVAHSTVDQSDASGLAKLSARLSAVEALFSQTAAPSAGDGQAALKEMIRTSVSVSQVILENSKATSIAQLLESKVKGESTFAYLPQILEANSVRTGTESTLAQSKARTRLNRLLHRDLSRVVFAEDKYFISEGVQGSRSRTEPIPTTHIIHRTLHDVSVGSDGIARYEKANFVFFTLRDPNVICGGRGRADRVNDMLAANARADALAGKPEPVPNSTTSRDVPLISDIFSLLHNFGRWGVDKQFAAKTSRDALQLEGRTASGEAVHHVLQGWLQSALSQQSADVLAMVQGDEQLARNPLVHILIDAANKCSNQIQQQCRAELLHWISGLSETAAIMNSRELEHAYLTTDMRRIFRKSGIPHDLIQHIFHPKGTEQASDESGVSERDPFLRVLPCDTHCKLTSRLLVDFGSNAVVPVLIPKTLHTSDGMPVPEGSVAFVGHATPDLITKCNNYFGEMAPIHQLSDLLVIPATQYIDASLAVELSQPQDPVWQSSMEMQFARLKTIQGQSVLMKRYRHNQFVPPTVLERSFVQNGNRYHTPQMGAPVYKKGRLVTFNKGSGAHEFVSRVLQSANLRKVVSFITK